jgi:hypothetical protein
MLAKGGQRDAKNFWSSLSKQTRGKSKNLKCNNGVRHEKHEDALIYEIRKCPVAEKKPDGAVAIGSYLRFCSQLFCRTATIPLPNFYKSVGQV